MTDKHMSTAQGHMNDKLRNHGLPAPKEADTAEPMSAEERAREIAKAVLCKGDEQIVLRLAPKQIRQAEQAARAETELKCAKECAELREKARAHERRKALEEAAALADLVGREDLGGAIRALKAKA